MAKIVLFYFVKERNDRINFIFLRYVLFKVRINIFLRYVLFKMRIIRVSIISYINCVEDEPESASTTLLSQASFRRRRKGYSFLGALESCLISGAISCLSDATERAAAASLPPRDRGLPRLTSDPVTWADKTRSQVVLDLLFSLDLVLDIRMAAGSTFFWLA